MYEGKPLQIVELGPGKGTLMIDLLRILSRIGYRQQDFSLHLIEISPMMQNEQAHRLCMTHRSSDENMPHYYEGETVSGIKVYWYNDISKVPQTFSWYIAHEFFDALPIHKFEKTSDGWRELLIDIDENDKLYYRISGKETQAVQLWIRPPLDSGNKKELEVSVKSLSIARQLAQRVDENGGIALIVDYGHEGEKGDTFRAFHKHKIVNPLENPGECDLTADVDFSQLRIAASKTSKEDNFAIVVGPVTQRDFLIRAEAESRLQVLLDNSKDEDKENLKAAFEMLTSTQKMGERFKFMAFYPSAMANILENITNVTICPGLGGTVPVSGDLSRCQQRSQHSPGFVSIPKDSFKINFFRARNACPTPCTGRQMIERAVRPRSAASMHLFLESVPVRECWAMDGGANNGIARRLRRRAGGMCLDV
ncbi:Protein arginine methyltransferase NDUFAF7 homolog, mitochondrial [Eumeta japonica]|uniref:Protein arginine methyltransferase NDUFAF7 n=1 Tax=Eumeta variegata TaxID=151549 RepID=A0A4C1X893_EUMVA|nr:Protein arginine methyltransferase NDUFAF7 homolog, mitochondrial [Eumeta japonica]